MRTVIGLLALAVLGCGASDRGSDTSESTAALSDDLGRPIPTLRFNADWSISQSGAIVSGRKLRVEYADDRMPTCRGELGGGRPGWSVTAHYRFAGGPVRTFPVAGLLPSGRAENVIELPAQMGDAELEIWFQNTSRWGCSAFDSNFGDNFRFTAAAPPEAPTWMGEVRYVSARATCDGSPCEHDRKPLAGSFRFDSWTRQRAAFHEISFQVYEPNVTDWDNPNAWRELDVKVHYRARPNGAFQTKFVDVDRRLGNDLRYRFDVATLDPFDVSHGPRPACPDAALHEEGPNVTAEVELYFSVNGVELRPAPGQSFRGSYEDGASQWAACLP